MLFALNTQVENALRACFIEIQVVGFTMIAYVATEQANF
jgi:hypothetical protein